MSLSNCLLELSEKGIAFEEGLKRWREEATEKNQYLGQTGLSHNNNKHHSGLRDKYYGYKEVLNYVSYTRII